VKRFGLDVVETVVANTHHHIHRFKMLWHGYTYHVIKILLKIYL
jgi:hypothetical protein